MSRFARQSEPESVYNLIPQEPEKTKPKPMHRSKYPHDCPPTASTFGASLAAQSLVTNLAGDYESMPRAHREKSATGILGPKVEHYSDPTSFIKKGQQHPPLPQPTRFEYPTTHKAALDTTLPATRVLASATHKSKNFIHENALAVIMAEARRPVDTTLNYLEKADFGRTPAYLHKVQQEISAEKEYIRQVMAAEQEEQTKYQPKMKMLPEEEREKLLESLKKKWEAVNKQYQGMTHVVTLDTIGKIRRKEEYETELQHLEKSIDKLSKKYVFVHDG